MSLKSKYQRFLANPTAAALADNASLHYITTLTSLSDPSAIIKHLAVTEKLLKKKEQKILSAVEGHNGLSVDVETTIGFVSGGGAYLPGLDDNFVADRTVVFPMVHVVHFDDDGKIVQIRLYWDQGSLLKQIDVIGARARNWPIRDGKDQSRLITSSSTHIAQPESAASSRPSTASRRSTTNAMNDPHASLELFRPREVDLEEEQVPQPGAQRAQSAKPKPRDLDELFVNGDAPSASLADVQATPAKSGAGKNFKPNRLFDEEEEDPAHPTPSSVKTSAEKYNHFEFSDGHDESTPKVSEAARPAVKSKHASQWDFGDFDTPAKTKVKIMGQSVRHFGWSDDEQEENSPVRRPVVHKARPDADPHFEFRDDGAPDGQRKVVSTKGRQHNKGLGLYSDHVLGTTSDTEDGAAKGDVKRPLNDVTTHVRNENRNKDFGAHWEMNDKSPAPAKTTSNANKLPENKKATTTNWEHYDNSPDSRGIKTAGNGMGARKGTDAGWSMYDESPDAKKLNAGIKSMGNGMGGRKGTSAGWSLTDESPEAKKENLGVRSLGNGMGGRKGVSAGWSMQDDSPDEDAANKKENMGVKSMGNGMGGRKGTGFDWDF